MISVAEEREPLYFHGGHTSSVRDIFRSIAKIRSAVTETRDSSRSFLARHVVPAAHRNRARRERAAGADEETPRARLRDSVTTFDVFRLSSPSRGERRPASVSRECASGFDPIRRESTRPRRPFLVRDVLASPETFERTGHFTRK